MGWLTTVGRGGDRYFPSGQLYIRELGDIRLVGIRLGIVIILALGLCTFSQ